VLNNEDIQPRCAELAVGGLLPYSTSVYVDECHSVASPADLFRTIRSIRALKLILGPEVEWRPYATSSVPQACPDPAAN
jgi:hypothetical protein